MGELFEKSSPTPLQKLLHKYGKAKSFVHEQTVDASKNSLVLPQAARGHQPYPLRKLFDIKNGIAIAIPHCLIVCIVLNAFNMCKSFFLALLGKESEPFFEEVGGGRVHFLSRVSALKICQWMLVGIVFALVDFACRYAVAEHFFDVSQGHFNGFVHLGGWIDIVPIFKVVAVAPLVVHPRVGAAEDFALALVGTSRSLVITRAGDKFGGRIFGEVVKKPLPADACTEAMANDTMAVTRNGAKMQKRMCHILSSFGFFFIIS